MKGQDSHDKQTRLHLHVLTCTPRVHTTQSDSSSELFTCTGFLALLPRPRPAAAMAALGPGWHLWLVHPIPFPLPPSSRRRFCPRFCGPGLGSKSCARFRAAAAAAILPLPAPFALPISCPFRASVASASSNWGARFAATCRAAALAEFCAAEASAAALPIQNFVGRLTSRPFAVRTGGLYRLSPEPEADGRGAIAGLRAGFPVLRVAACRGACAIFDLAIIEASLPGATDCWCCTRTSCPWRTS